MRPTTIEPGQFQPGKQLRTLRNLLPYLWPRERADLRLRVVLAIAFLVAAKAANVCVPILLRAAVDGLGAPVESIVVVPLALLLAYGAARVLALGFGELRDALFVKVAQHAIRRVALATLGRAPAAQQKTDFLVAPDKRRQARRMHGLEAAVGDPFGARAVQRHRRRQTLQVLRTEIVEIEHVADQPARAVADNHRSRLG